MLVELKSGELYRGSLVECEDNWNCQVENVTFTAKVSTFNAAAYSHALQILNFNFLSFHLFSLLCFSSTPLFESYETLIDIPSR
ncbi:putative like-Sm (LSM) domain containing protein, LSm4/SmD1/SmD3 [Helianthus anomalus]